MQSGISSNKRILLPISFSKASQNLFDYGLELCLALDKSMMLLYVADLSEFSSLQDYYKQHDKIKQEVAEKIKKIYLSRAQKKYPSVAIHVAIKGGDTLNKVINASKLEKIDQVLVSAGLKTGLKKALFGNIGELIERADCSILLVPEDIPFHPFNHFVYVTDYKKADFIKLKRLVRLAQQYRSKITVLHLTDEIKNKDVVAHNRFKELAKKKFQYANFEFALFPDKDTAGGIYRFALKEKADALCC